ncbi:MAG: hypothetical protein Q9184_007727, partial [Pyrenodesmia sp. 2 TL-2023]
RKRHALEAQGIHPSESEHESEEEQQTASEGEGDDGNIGSDSRHDRPVDAKEEQELHEAMLPTILHFINLTGKLPVIDSCSKRYLLIHWDLHRQLQLALGISENQRVPSLVGYGKWTGGINTSHSFTFQIGTRLYHLTAIYSKLCSSAVMAKAKRPKTPRRKRAQRQKSPTVAKPKPAKVAKAKKTASPKGTILNTPRHGMRTRARAAEVYDQCERYQKHHVSSSPPLSPKTPPPTASTKAKRPVALWDALSTSRSFWNTVQEAAASSRESSYDNTNIDHIMSRLNTSISNQFDSYKYENFGFLSSSPGGYDPRELHPNTDEETSELQLAIWPTVQHILELTKAAIQLPNQKVSYLDQIRDIRRQLRDTWQNQGHPNNAPSPFQLEAWTGGISNWRTSTYTNGTARFPATLVNTQLEIWRVELPSPTLNDTSGNIDNEVDNDISSPEIFRASAEWNNNSTSPTPTRRRRPISTIYDSDRDIGFLPTRSQIQAYQSGRALSTTLPSLSMAYTGGLGIDVDTMPFPSRRGSGAIVIFEDPNSPPPSASAGNGGGGDVDAEEEFRDWTVMDEDSDKENDMGAAVRAFRAQQPEDYTTPSSSQDAIQPVGERMVRSELTGEQWEVERGLGWGDPC